MQINKGEGVFAKLGLGISLGHLAGYDDEKGLEYLRRRLFGREAINEEKERNGVR